jgi:hypothetical protein
MLQTASTDDPPATCTAGRQIHTETDAGEVSICGPTSDDTWAQLYPNSSTTENSTLTTVRLVDEFPRGASFVAATSSAGIGETNWRSNGSAGGSGAPGSPVADHPGIYRLTTTTSDDSASQMSNLGVDTGNYSADDWELNVILAPEDAVTSTAISVGLMDAFPSTVAAGIRITYDTDLSHATWIFQICDSSSSGCQSAGDDTNSDTVASTKAPAAGTWQRLRIRFDPTGVGGNPTYYFSVGDTGAMETEKTFCSSGCDSTMANLPTADMFVIVSIITRAASTIKDLDLDYYDFAITQAFARY